MCSLLSLLPVLGSAWPFLSQHAKWLQSLPPLEATLPRNSFSFCAKQRAARGETARLGLFPENSSIRREKGHSEPSADPPSTGWAPNFRAAESCKHVGGVVTWTFLREAGPAHSLSSHSSMVSWRKWWTDPHTPAALG